MEHVELAPSQVHFFSKIVFKYGHCPAKTLPTLWTVYFIPPHIKNSTNPILFCYNVKEYKDWCGARTVYNSAGLWTLSGTPANQAGGELDTKICTSTQQKIQPCIQNLATSTGQNSYFPYFLLPQQEFQILKDNNTHVKRIKPFPV
jgi:hypothetical protein